MEVRALTIALTSLMLASCTTLTVGGANVYGRTRDVLRADIEAAFLAYRSLSPQIAPVRSIAEAQVVSKDEIHVFWYRGCRNCTVLRRTRGVWRYSETVVFTE